MSPCIQGAAHHRTEPFCAPAVVARDLRRICIHEFAHQEVARLLGVLGHVRIERNPNGGWHEKHFSGRFHFYCGLDQRQARLIGLAGKVAEQLDEDDFDAFEFVDDLDTGEIELSGTDAESAGDFDENDVDEAAALVIQAWEAIEEATAFESANWMDEDDVRALIEGGAE